MAGRKPTITDSEILQVFYDHEDPVLTTSEVANEFDITHRGTYSRLVQLEEDGKVKRKKVGERGAVWWVPNTVDK